MRIDKVAHTSQPWRIHEIADDFELEDAWALPTPGGPGELPRVVSTIFDGPDDPLVVRVLSAVRFKLGGLLGLDRESAGFGGSAEPVRQALPADLRDTKPNPDLDLHPFQFVYQTGDEFAVELANRTVHLVAHFGWVRSDDGGYHAQLAVLVKPNGLLGRAYLAAIKPIRLAVVYPAWLRGIARSWERTDPEYRALPPGQRKVDGFPRFGTHLHRPPPEIPPNPAIRITGAIGDPVTVARTDLDDLPQVRRTADFHCVAGWSATGLRWEGVSFPHFYRTLIEPRLAPGTAVTHLVFRGWDRIGAIVCLEDALADDVLIATGLDGQPLTPAHGAPMRLVSPSQYGFNSIKHLRTIEIHTSRPRDDHPYTVLTRGHPRARVWWEERHEWFPAAVMRPIYRPLIRPITRISARGVK